MEGFFSESEQIFPITLIGLKIFRNSSPSFAGSPPGTFLGSSDPSLHRWRFFQKQPSPLGRTRPLLPQPHFSFDDPTNFVRTTFPLTSPVRPSSRACKACPLEWTLFSGPLSPTHSPAQRGPSHFPAEQAAFVNFEISLSPPFFFEISSPVPAVSAGMRSGEMAPPFFWPDLFLFTSLSVRERS